jgi:hypothetical protein
VVVVPECEHVIIARLPPFSPIPTRIGEVHRKLNFSET